MWSGGTSSSLSAHTGFSTSGPLSSAAPVTSTPSAAASRILPPAMTCAASGSCSRTAFWRAAAASAGPASAGSPPAAAAISAWAPPSWARNFCVSPCSIVGSSRAAHATCDATCDLSARSVCSAAPFIASAIALRSESRAVDTSASTPWRSFARVSSSNRSSSSSARSSCSVRVSSAFSFSSASNASFALPRRSRTSAISAFIVRTSSACAARSRASRSSRAAVAARASSGSAASLRTCSSSNASLSVSQSAAFCAYARASSSCEVSSCWRRLTSAIVWSCRSIVRKGFAQLQVCQRPRATDAGARSREPATAQRANAVVLRQQQRTREHQRRARRCLLNARPDQNQMSMPRRGRRPSRSRSLNRRPHSSAASSPANTRRGSGRRSTTGRSARRTWPTSCRRATSCSSRASAPSTRACAGS